MMLFLGETALSDAKGGDQFFFFLLLFFNSLLLLLLPLSVLVFAFVTFGGMEFVAVVRVERGCLRVSEFDFVSLIDVAVFVSIGTTEGGGEEDHCLRLAEERRLLCSSVLRDEEEET